MNIAIVLLSFVLSFGVVSTALATPMKASGNWDLVNRTGQDVNDFHMNVESDTGLTLIGHVDGAFPGFHPSGNAGSQNQFFDWDGATIANGGETHLGLSFSMETFNNVYVTDAYWTKDKIKVGNSIALPQFDVTPGLGVSSSTMRLSNSSATETIYFGNVSYIVSMVETALPDLNFNSAGLGISVSDFALVPLGGFFDVFADLPLFPGQFARVQGEFFADAAHNILLGRASFEHEHGVPVPSSAWLIVIGLMGLVGNRLSKIMRRNSSVGSEFNATAIT